MFMLWDMEGMDDKVVKFPLHRRGLAGPADLPAKMTVKRLLMVANMLESAARETPYPLWVSGLANEVRRVARQVMK